MNRASGAVTVGMVVPAAAAAADDAGGVNVTPPHLSMATFCIQDFVSLGPIADRPNFILVRHQSRYFRMHRDVFSALRNHLENDPPCDKTMSEAEHFKTATARHVARFLESVSNGDIATRQVRELGTVDAYRLAQRIANWCRPISELPGSAKIALISLLFGANLLLAWRGVQLGVSGLTFHFQAVFVTVGMLLITIIHELFHAAAALNLGCHVGRLGLGLYRIVPVFFADVSDIWRLRARDRIVVDAAGIFIQLLIGPLPYLAANASLFSGVPFWFLFKANLFVVCLNPLPFARLDGYWIASDIFDVANLQKESRLALKRFFNRRASAPETEFGRDFLIGIYAALNIAFSAFIFLSFLIVVYGFARSVASHPVTPAYLSELAGKPLTWFAASFLCLRIIALWRRLSRPKRKVGS